IKPSSGMRWIERYSVPALSLTSPSVRAATSWMMRQPWRSSSATASRMWKVASGSGRSDSISARSSGMDRPDYIHAGYIVNGHRARTCKSPPQPVRKLERLADGELEEQLARGAHPPPAKGCVRVLKAVAVAHVNRRPGLRHVRRQHVQEQRSPGRQRGAG